MKCRNICLADIQGCMQARSAEDLDKDEDRRAFEEERKTVGQERSERVEEGSQRCSGVKAAGIFGFGGRQICFITYRDCSHVKGFRVLGSCWRSPSLSALSGGFS